MSDIGETLRETRMKARIDISELESQTKIRAKYLRALENEEWDLLPGSTFVKSFLRTYGDALGLDGKRLVDEYKMRYENPRELDLQPITPPRASETRRRERESSRRSPLLILAAVLVIALVGALWVLGSTGGGHRSPSKQTTSRSTTTPSSQRTTPSRPHARLITLQVLPTASVYVCLTTPGGHTLINGQTLTPGTAAQTYTGRQFLVVLGNGSVKLKIDGTVRTVPQTGNGIAYSITHYGRHTLASSQWPKCS